MLGDAVAKVMKPYVFDFRLLFSRHPREFVNRLHGMVLFPVARSREDPCTARPWLAFDYGLCIRVE